MQQSFSEKREQQVKEVEKADLDQLNNVFSLRRPRDIGAGLSSGVKSIVKGILAGGVSLIGAPIIGAVSDGWIGFAKGVGVGVAGIIILPIAGLSIGIAQIVRGAINTPEAIRCFSEGLVWDHESRQWIKNPGMALILDRDEFVPLRQQWQQDPQNQASSSGRIESEDLYEILGVSHDATPEQIKRQYYILARKMHPDKNTGDPEAKLKFQKLSEAYQVLGDAELRQRYDANGQKGLDVNFMDASEFFTMLFGSDKFEHLIGELVLASVARNGGEFSLAQLKSLQVVREEKCSTMLKALLRRFVEGDEEGFQSSTQAEALQLADTEYGAKILLVLGKVYELQAEAHLGGVILGLGANIRSRAHTTKIQMSAAKMAIRTVHAQMKLSNMEENESKIETEKDRKTLMKREDGDFELIENEEEEEAIRKMESAARRQKMEEAALPLMLDAMWAANVMDIDNTVRSVCHKVLNDQEVTKVVRRKRGEALALMGRIFSNTAEELVNTYEKASKEEKPRLAKERMEAAMQKVVEKRHAQDDALYNSTV